MSLTNTFLAVLTPITIWAILLSFMLAVLLALDDGLRRLKKLHQVPCYRCRYYTGSSYLKCSVRPLEAGSEKALHCLDYEGRDSPLPGISASLHRLPKSWQRLHRQS